MLDEMDEKILELYFEDSRKSYRSIARKVGVAPGTVVTRMKRLETLGIIKRYTVQVDSEKLGYDLTVIIECIISKGMMIEVGHEITKFRNTRAIYNVTGDSDVMIIAKFRNRTELSNFTKKLLKVPNIERTKTHLVLITVKEDFNRV
jgi:DNA-binding Lrp family transcriptional regulator